MPSRSLVSPAYKRDLAYLSPDLGGVLVPEMQGGYSVAEEIKQDEILLGLEMTDISSEGINLAGGAGDKVFLPAVDSLESVRRETRDVLAACRRHEILNGRRHIVLGSVFLRIEAHAHSLVSLIYKQSAYLKAHSSRRTPLAHERVFAPGRISRRLAVAGGDFVMSVRAGLQTQAAFYTFFLVGNHGGVEPVLVLA